MQKKKDTGRKAGWKILTPAQETDCDMQTAFAALYFHRHWAKDMFELCEPFQSGLQVWRTRHCKENRGCRPVGKTPTDMCFNVRSFGSRNNGVPDFEEISFGNPDTVTSGNALWQARIENDVAGIHFHQLADGPEQDRG